MRAVEKFNQSAFSHFINGPAGRLLRAVVGAALIVLGFAYRDSWLGVTAMIVGLLPLSAGAFDLCFVSALLGGPLSGAKIREGHHHQLPPQVRQHPS